MEASIGYVEKAFLISVMIQTPSHRRQYRTDGDLINIIRYLNGK